MSAATRAPLLEDSSLTGLESLHRIIAGDWAIMPMGKLLRYRLIEAQEGHVALEAVPQPEFYNLIGVVHGGWPGVILDTTMAFAILSMLPGRRRHTTVEYKINLVRPILVEMGPLRCEANAIHVGQRTGTSEGRLLDASGRILAHGTETCLIFDV